MILANALAALLGNLLGNLAGALIQAAANVRWRTTTRWRPIRPLWRRLFGGGR